MTLERESDERVAALYASAPSRGTEERVARRLAQPTADTAVAPKAPRNRGSNGGPKAKY